MAPNTKSKLLIGAVLLAGLGVVIITWQGGAVPAPPHATSVKPVNLAELQAKAEAGDPAAQTQLGRVFQEGTLTNANAALAVQWFKRAAAQQYAEAQAALGEMTQSGRGVPRDEQEAARLYRLAALQGNLTAQYNLAFMYEQGTGVAKDETQAAKYYLLAAEGGDPLAQYDIGQRYRLGVGVPVNLPAAFQWLSLAAQQGQSDSAKLLQTLKGEMSSEEIKQGKQLVKSFPPRPQLP